MAKFLVTRKEVWTSGILVEADTEVEAMRIVDDCGGDEIDTLLEYHHTMDTDSWDIEKLTDEEASKLKIKE